MVRANRYVPMLFSNPKKLKANGDLGYFIFF